MALALYRKYRPASFAEVVGQEHVTEPLRNALRSGRINHAYLFSGPRGCGKTSSARILARSLNCANGPTDEPCGVCNSCVGLAPNGPGTVDVIELDAASHGGVDDARELRDRAFYAPAEATYRVFIIDEAHMVTTQGFNALLKIVEEPPEHLIFIFATTEPDKVLPTIRSRTHHYPFRLIPPKPMRELLERNCAAEGIAVAPAVFPLVIRAGGGSARDSQSVLDQLLSGAGVDGVAYERAVALLGVTDAALIDDVIDALAAEDRATVFGTIERLVDAGHDPRRFATDLLDRLRDLTLLHAVPDAAEQGLVNAPEDQVARMVAQTQHLGPATLARFAEIVHAGLTEMRGATSPRLLLELVCARMLLPSATDAEAAVLQRVERLERRMTASGSEVTPQSTSGAVATSGAAPAGAPAAEGPTKRFERPSKRTLAEADSLPAGGAAASTSDAPAVAGSLAESCAADGTDAQPGIAQRPAAPGSGTAQVAQEHPAAATEPAAARGGAAEVHPEPTQTSQPAAEPQPEPAAPEPQPAEPGSAPVGEMDAAAVRSVWPEVLGAVRAASRSVEAMLSQATVRTVEGSAITLAHISAPLVRRLSETRNTEVVQGALQEAIGGTWEVNWVHGDTPAAQEPSATRAQQGAPRTPLARPSTRERGRQQGPDEDSAQRSTASVQDAPPAPGPAPEPQPEPAEPLGEEEMLAEAARPPSPDEEINHRTQE
ncbi:MAG: DNA polymerase III subunit gamma and tau, partial [Sciscionella sp.]